MADTAYLAEFLMHFTDRLRTDVVACYYPPGEGEKRGKYKPSHIPLSMSDIAAHVAAGGPALGLYLLTPENPTTCRAAVVDLDDKEKKLTWPELCLQAKIVADRLQAQEGWLAWPCRSGSGHGVHLWYLWHQPQPAAAVRAILKAATKDIPLHIDIFPGQDALPPEGVGSLVALPLARASRPILNLETGQVAEDLSSWSGASPALSPPARTPQKASSNRENPSSKQGKGASSSVIEGSFGPVSPEMLREALEKVRPDQYEVWMKVGLALKQAVAGNQLPEEDAERIWAAWSATDPKFNEREQDYQWKRLRPNGSMTLGTIWHLATEAGWKPPKQERTVGEVPPAVLELNADHFMCMEAGKVHIYKEDYDEVLQRNALIRMKPYDFTVFHRDTRVVTGHNGKGVPITQDLGTAWLESPGKRKYRKMVMQPEGAHPSVYNMWKGFTVEPGESGSCELFKAHLLENLCRGNQQHYQYLMNWCALTIQHPERPIGVAVVLRGDRGTGKGTFGRCFGELFGHHFLHITSTRALTGNFNSHLRDCVVLFADEAVWAGSKSEESSLKGYITEPTITIEGKGIDLVQCRNMLHLIISTNSEWSVPAGLDERRFFALHVDEKRKQDRKYFDPILQELEQGGRSRFLWELMQTDLKDFDQFNVPQTTELLRQKFLSLDPWAEWWYEKLNDGSLLGWDNWAEGIPLVGLYYDYVLHCRLSGIRSVRSSEHLSRVLRGLLPAEPRTYRQRLQNDLVCEIATVKAGRKVTMWVPPTLDTCREFFAKKAKAGIIWPEVLGDDPVKKAADDPPIEFL